jgi:hypothetical protein
MKNVVILVDEKTKPIKACSFGILRTGSERSRMGEYRKLSDALENVFMEFFWFSRANGFAILAYE